MKRLIPTLVLVILCIGGYFYASKHNFFQEKTDDVKQLVTKVEAANVQTVSLQTGDSAIELNRADASNWTMTKPHELPTDSSSVEGWIDSYNMLTYEAKVEDNAADLAKYGLDKPKETFRLKLKDGTERTVSVGSPLAIQGFDYVSVDNGKTVYQVSEENLKTLDKAPVDFQVKGPVKFDSDKVTTLQVTWKGQSWSLTKTDKDKPAADASWKLASKDMKGADASQVLDAFLFIATQQEAKLAGSVNLTAPEFTAEVTETDKGTAKTTKYQGKIDGDNVWIVKDGDRWGYAIPVKSIQDLADKGKQS